MAGLGVRIFTDEMIDPDLAVTLRRHGYDAESCHEAGRANQRVPDDEQLIYATRQSRAILTLNVADFFRIERAWKVSGRRHAGIVLAPPINDFGTLLRCVQRHLDEIEPEVQDNTLLWLDTSGIVSP